MHAGDWFRSKIETMRRYPFAIAFENSNAKDYVTEKLFGAFVAGSVPIHMGVGSLSILCRPVSVCVCVLVSSSPEDGR